MAKWVYLPKQGNKAMTELLGGKGAGLAEMTNLGLPVPFSFTITTEACNDYNKRDGKLPTGLMRQVQSAIKQMEKKTGKGFGDYENPLLVSVRSGAPISMPGMMDTVLNIGLNDETLQGLILQTGDKRFAYDTYRRLIQMFGKTVMGIDSLDDSFDDLKKKLQVTDDSALTASQLSGIVTNLKNEYKDSAKGEFPQDPYVQLETAIRAVFDSWMGRRAISYRRVNQIPDYLGTAVNVCAMVFGNMGDNSGSGVVFSRNPQTGEKMMYGEFLPNAQGEDVVSGSRTPMPITSMAEYMPEAFADLVDTISVLENHYHDMQDIEFTVEQGELFILQTRSGKRTPLAGMKIAVNLCEEGIIDRSVAIARVDLGKISKTIKPVFTADAKQGAQLLGRGTGASPGAVSGKVCCEPSTAVYQKAKGNSVILVRHETSPDDIEGMFAATGILTAKGGITSHAAIVSVESGIPCVVGCPEISSVSGDYFVLKSGRVIKDMETISIDGVTGEVFVGTVQAVQPEELYPELKTLQEWAAG